MKVNAWKNIDVEFEADVSLDDCINEMLDIANSDDAPYRKIAAIDGATRIMERIVPEAIGNRLTQWAIDLVRSRLTLWLHVLENNPAATSGTVPGRASE